MSQSLQKGFTLIELLVVIAIIGALSSVVLAALNSSRNKGANAAIRSTMTNARAQAELYNDTCGSYNATGGCGGGHVCLNTSIGIAKFVTAVQTISGASAECNRDITNGLSYAFQSPLKTAEGGYTFWCVDSTGASKGETAALGANTACQ